MSNKLIYSNFFFFLSYNQVFQLSKAKIFRIGLADNIGKCYLNQEILTINYTNQISKCMEKEPKRHNVELT